MREDRNDITVFSWVMMLVATCVASVDLGIAISTSNGAPQKAAAATCARIATTSSRALQS